MTARRKAKRPKFFLTVYFNGEIFDGLPREFKDETGSSTIGTSWLRIVHNLPEFVPDEIIGRVTRVMPEFGATVWANRRSWPMEFGLPFEPCQISVRVDR